MSELTARRGGAASAGELLYGLGAAPLGPPGDLTRASGNCSKLTDLLTY